MDVVTDALVTGFTVDEHGSYVLVGEPGFDLPDGIPDDLWTFIDGDYDGMASFHDPLDANGDGNFGDPFDLVLFQGDALADGTSVSPDCDRLEQDAVQAMGLEFADRDHIELPLDLPAPVIDAEMVRGDVHQIRAESGEILLGEAVCSPGCVSPGTFLDPEVPPVGRGFFYVWGDGTYAFGNCWACLPRVPPACSTVRAGQE
jgi:hypothetical protein